MRITAWKTTTASLTLAAGIVTPLVMSAAPAAADTAPAAASACGAKASQFASATGDTVYKGSLVHGNTTGAAAPDGPITVTLHHGAAKVTAADLPASAGKYTYEKWDGVSFLLWSNGHYVFALHAKACDASGQVTNGTVEVITLKGDKVSTASGAHVTRNQPSKG